MHRRYFLWFNYGDTANRVSPLILPACWNWDTFTNAREAVRKPHYVRQPLAGLGSTDAKYLMVFCVLHNGLRNRGESMRVQSLAFARSGSSIALPELTKNSPPDCFPSVNSPPQVLRAYIRIGIGAALRMQSGNRWEFKSPYAH